jgi:quinol monooxygenase YgiN
MLTRIVRMHFRTAEVPNFLAIFKESHPKISKVAGVHQVDLYQDWQNPDVFYTYSIWDNEECLNAYRDSTLFEGVWAATKALFAEKPKAYSLRKKNVEEL